LPAETGGDQPCQGGGNVFTFDRSSRALLRGWWPIED
jgi:hypothetical protein